jgi:hypothetical protein
MTGASFWRYQLFEPENPVYGSSEQFILVSLPSRQWIAGRSILFFAGLQKFFLECGGEMERKELHNSISCGSAGFNKVMGVH